MDAANFYRVKSGKIWVLGRIYVPVEAKMDRISEDHIRNPRFGLSLSKTSARCDAKPSLAHAC